MKASIQYLADFMRMSRVVVYDNRGEFVCGFGYTGGQSAAKKIAVDTLRVDVKDAERQVQKALERLNRKRSMLDAVERIIPCDLADAEGRVYTPRERAAMFLTSVTNAKAFIEGWEAMSVGNFLIERMPDMYWHVHEGTGFVTRQKTLLDAFTEIFALARKDFDLATFRQIR